ncbi:MAG: LysM peptidoglycan-binding domain-containing protein [Chthoniobacter sp.]|nr:LysM peptidoglycan-binding domain-containing protein [Chthoniobacter sp.]
MTTFPRHAASLLLLLAMGLGSGCTRLFDNGTKDNLATAEKKAAAGDFRGAVQFYEASLDGTAKSAETHYNLAVLYTEKLKSPLDALHHLERYLALAPTGPHAKDARNLKKEDQVNLRTELSNGAPTNPADANRLRDENKKLREENAELMKQIAALRTLKSQGPIATGQPEKKPIPKGARTYTVKSGDTFAKISRDFYKTSARAKTIQDANFERATGTVKIKPGMVLIIP